MMSLMHAQNNANAASGSKWADHTHHSARRAIAAAEVSWEGFALRKRNTQPTRLA